MEKAKTHISTHKIWKINEKYLAKNANELGAYTTRAFACIRPHCTHTHTPVHIATAADESQKIPKKKGTANQAHTHIHAATSTAAMHTQVQQRMHRAMRDYSFCCYYWRLCGCCNCNCCCIRLNSGIGYRYMVARLQQ